VPATKRTKARPPAIAPTEKLSAQRKLLERLEAGESVSTREFKRVLSAEHWRDYESRRNFEKSQRAQAADARYALRDYLRLLRTADLHEARMASLSGRRRRANAGAWRSDSRFERALERLRELTTAQPWLLVHLDRPFDPSDCSPNSNVGADSERIPRLAQADRSDATASIREFKVDALKAAIDEPQIETPQQEMNVQLMANLEKLRALVRR
jgi:hypothetical protein